MDAQDFEMEDRPCRCECTQKFRVWKQSKQRYYSKSHEWWHQSIVKKNPKYAKYSSQLGMGAMFGNHSEQYKRDKLNDYLD